MITTNNTGNASHLKVSNRFIKMGFYMSFWSRKI